MEVIKTEAKTTRTSIIDSLERFESIVSNFENLMAKLHHEPMSEKMLNQLDEILLK
jgi:predicted DNA-binding protein YlxM (UPF0122 family)